MKNIIFKLGISLLPSIVRYFRVRKLKKSEYLLVDRFVKHIYINQKYTLNLPLSALEELKNKITQMGYTSSVHHPNQFNQIKKSNNV